MKTSLSKMLLVLTLVLTTAILAGCVPKTPTGQSGENGTDDARYGGNFRLATDLVSSIIDPHLSGGWMASYQWMQYVFETPISRASSGKFYPLLCDYDLSEDGLTLKLTMLPDRFFSDGTPVTIDDVVASIKRVGKYYANFAESFTDILESEEVTGDSATFTFTKYTPNTLLRLAQETGPCYIMKKSLLDSLGDSEIEDLSDLIGTGCYTLAKYEPDTEITLKKNPSYVPLEYEGADGAAGPRRAYFDTITFCVNLDDTSRTAGLLAGDYHFGSVLPDMIPQAKDAGLKPYYLHNEWTPAIFFNLDESKAGSPVYDKNFRKAVRAALDMEAIMLSIRDGEKEAFALEPDPMSVHSQYHNDIIKNTEWNIKDKDLAKEYLAASNYNGEPIIWLCSQSASFYKAAVVGIQMLEEIGINAEMKLVDPGAHTGLRGDPKTGHDIGAWEAQKTSTFPPQNGSFVKGTSGGWWSHPEKTRLLEIMEGSVMGSQESIDAYEEFCNLVVEEVPWITFGELYTVRFVRSDLTLDYQGTNAYYWNSYFEKD